jgi:hypothetical protein
MQENICAVESIIISEMSRLTHLIAKYHQGMCLYTLWIQFSSVSFCQDFKSESPEYEA